MNALSLFPALALCFSLLSCKTQRPVIDIEDRVPLEDTNLMSDDGPSKPSAYLKVSDLNFPVAVPYTRISLLLKANGIPDQSVANYTLKNRVPLKAAVTYALTVTVYVAGRPVFSNTHCKNSNKFTARSGSNNYTVPMCAIPDVVESIKEALDKESDEPDQMIETPSVPGD